LAQLSTSKRGVKRWTYVGQTTTPNKGDKTKKEEQRKLEVQMGSKHPVQR
jgi:hypothetical protein